MKPRQLLIVASVCVCCTCHAMPNAFGVELSHGRQVVLNRGLQIQSLIWANAPGVSDIDLWKTANFTTWNIWAMSVPWIPSGTQWGRLYDYPFQPTSAKYLDTWHPEAMSHLDQFASFQYGDEIGKSSGVIGNPTLMADMRTTFDAWRSLYPNTLVYTNFAGYREVNNQAGLRTYMQTTHPDMLCMDVYPSFSFSNGARNDWYAKMQGFRQVALEGWDGTGRTPIACGQYLNMYRESYGDAKPSESYVRLQQNASWAFGHTFVSAFVYNDPISTNVVSVMFDSAGDTQPNEVFGYVAETNRQSRNLGQALTRLVNTDIRMIPGSGKSVSGTGVTQWNADGYWTKAGIPSTGGYLDYLSAITPTVSEGGPIDTTYNDILIGYFKPLKDDNSGFTFADGLHFMIVNGSASGTAAASAQWYHVDFDFAGTDFDSLVRMSRDTGRVELVPLTLQSGSNYAFDLYLPGGTGDLFAFWDSSNPLPTPEPGALGMLAIGLGGMAAYTWKKRNTR